MADKKPTLFINVYRHTNTLGEGQETKWYGRMNRQKTLNTRGLALHISKHGSPFTEDIIEGVLRKLASCIPELVATGQGVKIDGLGTFYGTVKSTGSEKLEDFSGSNIETVNMRFTADRDRSEDVRDMRSMVNVETKYVLEKEKVTVAGKEKTIKHYIPVADYLDRQNADGHNPVEP